MCLGGIAKIKDDRIALVRLERGQEFAQLLLGRCWAKRDEVRDVALNCIRLKRIISIELVNRNKGALPIRKSRRLYEYKTIPFIYLPHPCCH